MAWTVPVEYSLSSSRQPSCQGVGLRGERHPRLRGGRGLSSHPVAVHAKRPGEMSKRGGAVGAAVSLGGFPC